MPPIPAPGADETATAIYGIRRPKNSRKAYKFYESVSRIADDVETALQAFGLPPVITGTPVVALSDAARDTYWGSPATAAARRALQDSGAMTVRPDKGWTETYFAGLTDGGANAGGVTTAGWYPVLGLLPAFQVGRGAAQAIPAGAHTLVNSAFGTPAVNTGFTSFAAGVVKVAKTGIYRVGVQVLWPATATALAHQVLVNSTAPDSAAMLVKAYNASGQSTGSSTLALLTAADELRLYVYSTSAQNLGNNPRDVNFSVEWVRPA